MKRERYCIYEITEQGMLRKATLLDFPSKEDAEQQIKKMWIPALTIKLIAVKTNS